MDKISKILHVMMMHQIEAFELEAFRLAHVPLAKTTAVLKTNTNRLLSRRSRAKT